VIPTARDWDAWRNAYPDLTYAEQQAFHTGIYEQYPVQRHYDPDLVATAIKDTMPHTVVELGGWDGELAKQMLDRYPFIEWWINVEICKEASKAGEGRHPRYTAADLNDWYWEYGPWEADLFIASHTIEHLSYPHLRQVIEATDAQALFLDAPLEDHALNWRGFTGTHILPVGWTQITKLLNTHGYHLAWAEDHKTNPSSGDKARACLYAKATA
jgi:hypothetical protein